MSESLVGYDFMPSKWEFTHVEFQGAEVGSIGLAVSVKESMVCLRLSPLDARHVAESILGILGEEKEG